MMAQNLEANIEVNDPRIVEEKAEIPGGTYDLLNDRRLRQFRCHPSTTQKIWAHRPSRVWLQACDLQISRVVLAVARLNTQGACTTSGLDLRHPTFHTGLCDIDLLSRLLKVA